jgi:hypothetical protein
VSSLRKQGPPPCHSCASRNPGSFECVPWCPSCASSSPGPPVCRPPCPSCASRDPGSFEYAPWCHSCASSSPGPLVSAPVALPAQAATPLRAWTVGQAAKPAAWPHFGEVSFSCWGEASFSYLGRSIVLLPGAKHRSPAWGNVQGRRRGTCWLRNVQDMPDTRDPQKLLVTVHGVAGGATEDNRKAGSVGGRQGPDGNSHRGGVPPR